MPEFAVITLSYNDLEVPITCNQQVSHAFSTLNPKDMFLPSAFPSVPLPLNSTRWSGYLQTESEETSGIKRKKRKKVRERECEDKEEKDDYV